MHYDKEEMDSLLDFLERLQSCYFNKGCMSEETMPPELFSWLLGFSDGTEKISVSNYKILPGIDNRVIQLGTTRIYSIIYSKLKDKQKEG